MNRFRLSFTVAIAILLWIGACGRGPSGKRLIVLGIDGMDYAVTRDLMERGRMPNFARLAAEGSFTPLATTMPPQSPVAWSTFITGLDSHGHGIYDFVHRDAATMLPYLSTTRTEPAGRALALGGWRFPLSGGRVTALREGQPFWDALERAGVAASIIRMPANFPPSGLATRELSGMGTPDILGSYGTFTFFSSAPDPAASRAPSGGRRVTVDVIDDVVATELTGPDHPFRTPARALSAPLTVYVDPVVASARLVIGQETRVLAVGEWTDWIPVEFPLMPTQALRGITRFHLKSLQPFELYASPVNLDPLDPAMPISTPADYAGELARATGRFYTQGMPEDTKGLIEGVLSRDEFLKQAAMAGEEVNRQYWKVLGDFEDGFLFYYFGNLDQISHMMWRPRDRQHPAYDAARDGQYATVVEDVYVTFDRLVGETIRRAGTGTAVIIMSDHGFASWRRSFHLNSWLRDRGYLAVADPSRADEPELFQNVDWSRTRAYGLGLNGLYLNMAGRERSGTVTAAERDALLRQIRSALLETIDPSTGKPVATAVHVSTMDEARRNLAPDLIVGYAAGTRVSNESAMGGVPREVLVNNTSEWSGDHCMDPAAVPGILLTNRRLLRTAASLDAVAGAILAEFGVQGFPRSQTAGAR